MIFPEENIEAVAYLFESTVGSTLDETQLNCVKKAGITQSDVPALVRALKNSVQNIRAADCGYRSKVYWALGKLYSDELLEFFQQMLEKEIGRNVEVAYQIMIALDNLDEPIFDPGREIFSVLDHKENLKDAMKYIKILQK